MKTYISYSECLFYLRTHSWCVITCSVWCVCICVCVSVWEPLGFVYFRGKWNAGVAYIKTDRPIWKQSSNVSWKKCYVMLQGMSRRCQHQYFPSRLAMEVVLTGLMYIKFLWMCLQVFSAIGWIIVSLFPPTHDLKCYIIDKQRQKIGRVLSVSPPPDRKFR